MNILATAHDRHDQDIASAINTLNARINSAIADIDMVLLSVATAATTISVIDFTLSTAGINVFGFEHIGLYTGAAVVLNIQFLDSANSPVGAYNMVKIYRKGAGAGADISTATRRRPRSTRLLPRTRYR